MAVLDLHPFRLGRAERPVAANRARDIHVTVGRARLLVVLEALVGLSALILIMTCALSARWLLWQMSILLQ
jgi:hypothetical protein